MYSVQTSYVRFQHTAARRRLDKNLEKQCFKRGFQHTAARRRLGPENANCLFDPRFQHTAARRRLANKFITRYNTIIVSTHSRPKAAGSSIAFCSSCIYCFNTQPPEGGWRLRLLKNNLIWMFQHTAARRRLGLVGCSVRGRDVVSTHSRPKAAGGYKLLTGLGQKVSTHSRPKAAGSVLGWCVSDLRGFNTQPPEGGWK